jgi:hypothetical protein
VANALPQCGYLALVVIIAVNRRTRPGEKPHELNHKKRNRNSTIRTISGVDPFLVLAFSSI